MSFFAKEVSTRTPTVAATTVTQKALHPAPLSTEDQPAKNNDKDERVTADENWYAAAIDGKCLSSRARMWITRETDTEEDRLLREANFSKEMDVIDALLNEKRAKWALKQKETEKALADLEHGRKHRIARALARHFIADEPSVFSSLGQIVYGGDTGRAFSRANLDFERKREDTRRMFLDCELGADRWPLYRLLWGAERRMEIIDRKHLMPRLNAKEEEIDRFFDTVRKWLESLPSVEECIPYYAGDPTEDTPKPAWEDVKHEFHSDLLARPTNGDRDDSSADVKDHNLTAGTNKNDDSAPLWPPARPCLLCLERNKQLGPLAHSTNTLEAAAARAEEDANWLDDAWVNANSCQRATKEEWARYVAQKRANAKAEDIRSVAEMEIAHEEAALLDALTELELDSDK